MTDSHLLRYIIRKNGDTVDNLACFMGIGRAALSSKINNKSEFKQSEIIIIAQKYHLTADMCVSVFAGELRCG